MDTFGIPLESFNLDEREFERCKHWTKFFTRYSFNKRCEEIDFDNLEAHFADANAGEEDDEFDENVIQIDEESEESLFERSVMQLQLFSSTLIQVQPHKKKFTHAGLLTAPVPDDKLLEEEEEEEDNGDIENVFNKTIPKLVKRRRELDQSGMSTVLNTFDAEKIEQTFGRWLRSKNNIIRVPPEKLQSDDAGDDHDEEDSLHSMDTARYVLANRKPRNNSSCRNMIKNYRLMQSKRDALRKKYAIPEEELARVLAKSKHTHERHTNIMNKHQTGRPLYSASAKSKALNKFVLVEKVLRSSEGVKHRRKVINKKRMLQYSKRPSSNSSSSEEDFSGDERKYNTLQKLQRPRRLRRRRSLHLPCSRSESPESKVAQLPPKPRRRLSECRCCNRKKLCQETEHLADTSTGDWVVENIDWPKKSAVTTSAEKKMVPQSKTSKKVTTKDNKVKDCRSKKKTKKLNKENKETKKHANRRGQEKNSKNEAGKTCLDSTFERDLKRATELSKQTYKAEADRFELIRKINGPIQHNKDNIKSRKCMQQHKIQDGSTLVEKEKNISQKKSFNFPLYALPSTSVKSEDPEKQEHLELKEESIESRDIPKEESLRNKSKCKIAENNVKPPSTLEAVVIDLTVPPPSLIDSISPSHFCLKPQPKSLKIKKVKRLLEKSRSAPVMGENTFLSRADRICNSTAVLNDDAASKKQFAASVSKDSSTAKQIKPSTTQNDKAAGAEAPDGPDDCSLVSSTTDDFLQRQAANANRNNILIYAPCKLDVVPTHSVSDGVFNITEEHLSKFIGSKAARGFMKYYIGRRRFDANLSVYYRPPPHKDFPAAVDSETGSDVDELEKMNCYGDLYAVCEN